MNINSFTQDQMHNAATRRKYLEAHADNYRMLIVKHCGIYQKLLTAPAGYYGWSHDDQMKFHEINHHNLMAKLSRIASLFGQLEYCINRLEEETRYEL
jgi:hypothetical protein